MHIAEDRAQKIGGHRSDAHPAGNTQLSETRQCAKAAKDHGLPIGSALRVSAIQVKRIPVTRGFAEQLNIRLSKYDRNLIANRRFLRIAWLHESLGKESDGAVA
jgi:hypothetical protein